MSVQRGLPRRPAWLYPEGSVLTMRDGRRFIVYYQETKVYDEFGVMGNPADYIYSRWRRQWKQIS